MLPNLGGISPVIVVSFQDVMLDLLCITVSVQETHHCRAGFVTLVPTSVRIGRTERAVRSCLECEVPIQDGSLTCLHTLHPFQQHCSRELPLLDVVTLENDEVHLLIRPTERHGVVHQLLV